MNRLNSYKLTVNRNKDILDNGPIIPRCYEVIYLKSSNAMSIIIDKNENKSKKLYTGKGLCGRWCCENDRYMLFFQINIDSKKKGNENIKEVNRQIRKELPLMINAIRTIEEKLFIENKNLDDSEIFIKFNCLDDEFYKVENWGKIKNYRDINTKDEKTIKERDIERCVINQKAKIDMQENLILSFLQYHIELFLFPMYGKDIKFLINDINILNIEEINTFKEIEKNHKVTVSVKVLRNIKIEEILLNIIVKNNKVVITPII